MPTSEPSWFLPIGEFFADRYDVRALVGRGTHGAVFDALDKNNETRVALKVIHPELLEDEATENLFLLRRALAYRSNELVPLRDVIETDERLVLVQPFESAPNLRTHLRLKVDANKSFDPLSGLRMITDIAGGLAWIHRFGPHGNIKPENIFVTDDGYRLHDAYRLHGIQRLSWSPDNPWTKDAYQAPEQYEGEPSLATDTFAFALIIGEALAGKPVRDGIALSAQSSLVAFKGFDDLFVAATARAPGDRPSTEEFTAEAGKILSSAGEDAVGAKPDMNITLVTKIPVISDSMMKDLEEGYSAKETLEREEERTSAEETSEHHEPAALSDAPPQADAGDDSTEGSVARSESIYANLDDRSLIGGLPLGVDFGLIVGRAIATILNRDVTPGRTDAQTDEDSSEETVGLSLSSQTTTITAESARAILNAQTETDPELPELPPSLPPEAEPSHIEDASVLELLPDDATPSPEDEEAEVFAEGDNELAGDGGLGDLIDLDSLPSDTQVVESVELSSDDLTVEEVSLNAAEQLSSQLVVEPLGEARDLVADSPRPPRRIRGSVDPTTLPTEITRQRDIEQSAATRSPHERISNDTSDSDSPVVPWYLAVAGAGVLAFAIVWFLATPSSTELQSSDAPGTPSAEDAPGAPAVEAVQTDPDPAPPKDTHTVAKEGSDAGSVAAPIPAAAIVGDSTNSPPLSSDARTEQAVQPKDSGATNTSANDTSTAEKKQPSDTETAAVNPDQAPGSAAPEEAPSQPLANLPTPSTCRDGYTEIPGTDQYPRFCIQTLEYHGSQTRPVRKIKYDDAAATCVAESGRLCTAAEFAGACGGAYPYGERFIRKKCNVMSAFFEARPVRPGGSFPGCSSPFGVMDLSGNVAEWVQGGLLAGGSSGQEGRSVACTRAVKRNPKRPSRTTGFRCCHNLQ